MRRVIQSFGAVFLVVGIGLLLAAVLTTSWVNITVDNDGASSSASNEIAYYSRNRGLYKECWETDSLSSVIRENAYYYSDLCLKLDARIEDIKTAVNYSSRYSERAALIIAVWSFLGVSAFLSIVAFILFLCTCCTNVENYRWKHCCKAAAAVMFGAAFCHVAAMAFYHGAEYLETEIINDSNGTQAPYKMFFVQDYSQDLLDRTTRMYGWSYALSWLSIACEFLSGVLFSIVSCCYVKKSKSQKLIYSKPASNTGTASRNPAYDHVEDRVVIAPPQIIVVTDDYYQGGARGHYDPYKKGQPKAAYSPKFNFDQGWQLN